MRPPLPCPVLEVVVEETAGVVTVNFDIADRGFVFFRHIAEFHAHLRGNQIFGFHQCADRIVEIHLAVACSAAGLELGIADMACAGAEAPFWRNVDVGDQFDWHAGEADAAVTGGGVADVVADRGLQREMPVEAIFGAAGKLYQAAGGDAAVGAVVVFELGQLVAAEGQAGAEEEMLLSAGAWAWAAPIDAIARAIESAIFFMERSK
jgi:hypothetical protein